MVDPGLFVFRDAACTDQDPIILDIWIQKTGFLGDRIRIRFIL